MPQRSTNRANGCGGNGFPPGSSVAPAALPGNPTRMQLPSLRGFYACNMQQRRRNRMNLRDALDIPAREITDEAVYRDRRRILAALGVLPALGVAGCSEAAPPPSPVTVTPEQAKSGFRTA